MNRKPSPISDVRYAARMFTICVLLPCLALVAIGVIACATANGSTYVPSKPHSSGVYAATEAPGVEICFPSADWSTAYGASAEDRPCDLLGRPQEDGSSRLYLGTVGADAAVCTIPNPYEERGHFTIQCRRVPNR
jgi:hypothetical protein